MCPLCHLFVKAGGFYTPFHCRELLSFNTPGVIIFRDLSLTLLSLAAVAGAPATVSQSDHVSPAEVGNY